MIIAFEMYVSINVNEICTSFMSVSSASSSLLDGRRCNKLPSKAELCGNAKVKQSTRRVSHHPNLAAVRKCQLFSICRSRSVPIVSVINRDLIGRC